MPIWGGKAQKIVRSTKKQQKRTSTVGGRIHAAKAEKRLEERRERESEAKQQKELRKLRSQETLSRQRVKTRRAKAAERATSPIGRVLGGKKNGIGKKSRGWWNRL